MAHAAESLHWYDRKGLPVYQVMRADKSGMRPTTLRDAKKLSLVPSVTAIIKCAAAPALEIWKQQQVLQSALTLPRVEGEAEKAYLDRILGDSKEQSRKAAERGSTIHAAIQGHYEGEPASEEMWPFIEGVKKVVHIHGTGWAAERSFSHPFGFGGKVDLSNHAVVIDFKTKEFDTVEDLKTWDEHAMQLSAYRHGLGMEKSRCAIVYVSTTAPGLCKLIEIPEDELQRGWTMFYSLLHFWQAKNSYRSAFEKLAA